MSPDDGLPRLAPRVFRMAGGTGGGEREVAMTALTTDRIAGWSAERKNALRHELSALYARAFPRMRVCHMNEFVDNYFKTVREGFHRQALLLRDSGGRLAATALFDQGTVRHGGASFRAIYINVRAVRPDCQGGALGQTMAVKILTELSPDILFTTTTQSASLHSWIKLPGEGAAPGYEVWPRPAEGGGGGFRTLPPSRRDFVIAAFRQSYREINPDGDGSVERALGNLSDRMVRRDLQEEVYDFDPWARGGREDELARFLALTPRDGVLIVFRRKTAGGE